MSKITGETKGTKRKALEPISSTASEAKLLKQVPSTTQVQTDSVESDFALPSSKEWNLKISSWNVAGLRALVKKVGITFFLKDDPDIICLQVSKY